MLRVIRCALIVAMMLLPIGPLQANTFPVTKTADTNDGICDPDCSLREAIEAANTNPGSDDVTVPAGFYLLTLGQLVVSDEVVIAGDGQTNTIIDGSAADRVLDVEALSGVVEISSVTIQNGYVSYYDSGYGVGGGIRNYADLTISESTVSDNRAALSGGGISNVYGNLTLTNSTVSGNFAGDAGGGLDIFYGKVTVTNSTLSGNAANEDYGFCVRFDGCARGGGIRIRGWEPDIAYVTITDSTVSGNASALGGGIYNAGTLSLVNSTVRENFTFAVHAPFFEYIGPDGGGIFNGASASLYSANSTVSENTAYNAGGISNTGGMILTNSTVSGNTALIRGGGILNGGVVTLTNSTVSGNTVFLISGGGIWNTGDFTLINTIVAGNAAPGGANCSGTIGGTNSVGYNLTDDDSCGFTAPGDLVVPDAMLGPLQGNGGPTATHALLPGSPAIDAGSTNCPPPDTDQRGVARPQGAACDIGAVECLPEPRGTLALIAGAAVLGLLYRERYWSLRASPARVENTIRPRM